jgi:hypothetical protein
MSADDQQPADQQDQPAESDHAEQDLTSTYQTKLEVHYRDQYECLNCRKWLEDDPNQAEADHRVPKGSGGASLHKNFGTLCDPCHEAKHEEDAIAPTIRFTSTGDMSDEEFRWYRHFWNEVLPALMQAAVNHRAEVLVGLDNSSVWDGRHIPLGAVRYCDKRLSDRDDIQYSPMMEHRYR